MKKYFKLINKNRMVFSPYLQQSLQLGTRLGLQIGLRPTLAVVLERAAALKRAAPGLLFLVFSLFIVFSWAEFAHAQSALKGELRAAPARTNWGMAHTEAQRAKHVASMSLPFRPEREVIVAVIDTGIDVKHPDLAGTLWINPGESGADEHGRDRSVNGIDDDRNGFIDDVHGWNFATDTPDLHDSNGHGTHIAGIITTNRTAQLKGLAPNAKLMILKYHQPGESTVGPLAASVQAVRYAVRMGAEIINYSGGGSEPSGIELNALREAQSKGVLIVAAAGNERSNSDLKPFYPADYELENILSVTAIDQNKKILPTSNWGERSVDLAAPGHKILSTLPGGSYGELTGTSQATAFATGVAALLLGQRGRKSPIETIEHLVSTGRMNMNLTGKTRHRMILNSYRALAIVESGVAAFGGVAMNLSGVDRNLFTFGGGDEINPTSKYPVRP